LRPEVRDYSGTWSTWMSRQIEDPSFAVLFSQSNDTDLSLWLFCLQGICGDHGPWAQPQSDREAVSKGQPN